MWLIFLIFTCILIMLIKMLLLLGFCKQKVQSRGTMPGHKLISAAHTVIILSIMGTD